MDTIKFAEDIILEGCPKPIQIVIERIGQQPPNTGDNVVVQAAIRLPTKKVDSEYAGLLPEISFGHRAKIAGKNLDYNWGTASPPQGIRSFREMTYKFTASTWKEAEQNASLWAFAEIEVLQEALDKRLAALKAADAS